MGCAASRPKLQNLSDSEESRVPLEDRPAQHDVDELGEGIRTCNQTVCVLAFRSGCFWCETGAAVLPAFVCQPGWLAVKTSR